MSASRTLIERLEKPDRNDQRRVGTQMSELKDSLRANLQRLLNSVQDGSAALPDFGLKSFSDLGAGDAGTKELARSIRQVIKRFEPRLKDARVSFVVDDADPLVVRFDIVATIRGSTNQKPMVFRSVVEPNGYIDIRR